MSSPEHGQREKKIERIECEHFRVHGKAKNVQGNVLPINFPGYEKKSNGGLLHQQSYKEE